MIPDSWEELSFDEKMFAFRILIRVLHGDLKHIPHVGLLKLFVKLTGYKHTPLKWKKAAGACMRFLKKWWMYIVNIPFLFNYGYKSFREYTSLLKEANRPDLASVDYEKEMINLALIKLSEQIDFIYEIDRETRTITPKYNFRTNPVPWIRIGKKKYTGKRFFIDVMASTDITARCFVDALDILLAMDKMTNTEDRNECINKICAMLYPAIPDHNENLLSGHAAMMRHVDPVIKFAIVYWFTGLVNLFRKHPVYHVLFDRNNTDSSDDKISVGMNEIALMLKKEGYGDPSDMNLIDYFDAQIKSLKDSISKAISEGVKPEKIAQKTGIPISTVNKLS